MTNLPSTISNPNPDLNAGSEAKLRFGPARGGSTASVLVTLTSAALAGAVSLNITSTGSVTAGATLNFQGVNVVTTAPITPASTTVAVQATSAALNSGETADHSDFRYVALATAMNYTESGKSDTKELFGSLWDVVVKTGLSGKLDCEVLLPASDPVAKDLIRAGRASGSAAVRSFIIDTPDGGFFVGFVSIDSCSPVFNSRQVYSYKVTAMTTGKVDFIEPA